MVKVVYNTSAWEKHSLFLSWHPASAQVSGPRSSGFVISITLSTSTTVIKSISYLRAGRWDVCTEPGRSAQKRLCLAASPISAARKRGPG